MRLTGLILRSSLSEEERDELLELLFDMRDYEVPDLVVYLEMTQLDLTQLSEYNNVDINKRLDFIEKSEKQ